MGTPDLLRVKMADIRTILKYLKVFMPLLYPEMMCLIAITSFWMLQATGFKMIKELWMMPEYETKILGLSVLTVVLIGNILPFISALRKVRMGRVTSLWAIISALLTMAVIQLWIVAAFGNPMNLGWLGLIMYLFALINGCFLIYIVFVLMPGGNEDVSSAKSTIINELYYDKLINWPLLFLLIIVGNVSMWALLHWFKPPVAGELTLQIGFGIITLMNKPQAGRNLR